MNDILRPNKGKSEIILSENNEVITNKSEVASIFNTFFVQKIETLKSKIDQKYKKDPLLKLKNQLKDRSQLFSLRTTSEGKVLNAIMSLKNKKSCGVDDIPTLILKLAGEILCIPLTKIINQSILTGTFPSAWKIAKIIPLHKRGSKKLKENYRPISNLCVVSKILEKVVLDQVGYYFESQGLLPNTQHGFRKKRSTTSALLTLTQQWTKAHEDGKNVGALFWDLSAAFDCLNRELLCKKLKLYGFSEKALDWFRSFLEDRKQLISVNSVESNVKVIKSGTPQGSLLSPLLFVIYVSDMQLWVKNSKISSYADDTCSFSMHNDLQSLREYLEEDAKCLMEFMASNDLVSNASKTGCLIIRKSNSAVDDSKILIKIGNDEVIEKEEEKLLGITLTNKLKWNVHLSQLESDLIQRLCTISRLKKFIPRCKLENVANSLFVSKILYALPVFGAVQLTNEERVDKDQRRIQIVMNQMLRILCNAKLSDKISLQRLHNMTGMLSVNQMVAKTILLETWKGINSVDIYGHDFLQFRSSKSNMETRAEVRKDIERHGSSQISKRNFGFKAAKLWNSAPINIRFAENMKIAKKEIDEFVRTLPL